MSSNRHAPHSVPAAVNVVLPKEGHAGARQSPAFRTSQSAPGLPASQTNHRKWLLLTVSPPPFLPFLPFLPQGAVHPKNRAFLHRRFEEPRGCVSRANVCVCVCQRAARKPPHRCNHLFLLYFSSGKLNELKGVFDILINVVSE